MKSIKFWAEHKEDTTNFFNALKAHGNTDNLEWVRDPRIFSGDGSETGWFVDNTGGVTYTRDEDYFGLHEAKEFFFPIPGTLLSDEVDMVNNPSHYTSHPSGIECIDVTRHFSFNLGNAMKYIWRCDLKKDAIEDLKKAVFYLNDEIKLREGKQ